jgi:antitoxin ParD1/3/4
MRTTQSLSITLPVEMAKMVRDKVSSGEYASESEVIRDGLRTLAARDVAVEKWLRDEVVPTIKAHDADPSRSLSAEDVRERLQLHMAGRRAKKSLDV